MQIDKVRREFKHAILDENNIFKNPFEQFEKWINETLSLNIPDATAMSLVSIGTNGFPQSRIVLLKDFSEVGFTFFTNYNSEKGKAIAQNSKVSLHFFWSELERQIRISGFAKKTSALVSANYFHSRPYASQIAALVSNQSSVIDSRELLEKSYSGMEDKLQGENPKCPDNWGGYVVKPVSFEFWQGRESRLHDRIVYEQKNDNWLIKRLAP